MKLKIVVNGKLEDTDYYFDEYFNLYNKFGKMLKPQSVGGNNKDKKYQSYYIKSKLRYKHRLVYQSCKGMIKNEINHKDTNKSNNHIDNLEDVTRSENQRHARKNIKYKKYKKREIVTTSYYEYDMYSWYGSFLGKRTGKDISTDKMNDNLFEKRNKYKIEKTDNGYLFMILGEGTIIEGKNYSFIKRFIENNYPDFKPRYYYYNNNLRFYNNYFKNKIKVKRKL